MAKIRRASDIRWYLYRSRTKLEMLYSQLVSSHRATGSISIEFPGVKASVGTSNDAPTDEERLALVEEQLRARDLVGTVSDPRDYIAGELPMRWGLFNDQGDRPADEAPLVFFGGLDKAEKIVVGLGGSSRHVVGHEGATSTYSRSNTGAIVHWMLAGLNDSDPERGLYEPEVERQQVLSAVGIALHYLRPPTQRLRFLAKTLVSGRMPGHEHFTGLPDARAILGTPLYVSLVDPPAGEDRWGLDDEW